LQQPVRRLQCRLPELTGPGMKSRRMNPCLLAACLVFTSPFVCAQGTPNGPPDIPIHYKLQSGELVCHAVNCFRSNAERERILIDSREYARAFCDKNSSPQVCAMHREKYEAEVQCDELCSRAKCLVTSVADGHCVGKAYFRP
jgi:hypothetical protein